VTITKIGAVYRSVPLEKRVEKTRKYTPIPGSRRIWKPRKTKKKNATLKQFWKEPAAAVSLQGTVGVDFGRAGERLRATPTRRSAAPSSCTTRALDCRRARSTGIVASALVTKLLVSAFRGMAAQDYRLCRMTSAGCLTVLFSVILHPANAAVVPAALGSRATGWELLDVNNGPLPHLDRC
jgi:hypothetical protein